MIGWVEGDRNCLTKMLTIVFDQTGFGFGGLVGTDASPSPEGKYVVEGQVNKGSFMQTCKQFCVVILGNSVSWVGKLCVHPFDSFVIWPMMYSWNVSGILLLFSSLFYTRQQNIWHLGHMIKYASLWISYLFDTFVILIADLVTTWHKRLIDALVEKGARSLALWSLRSLDFLINYCLFGDSLISSISWWLERRLFCNNEVLWSIFFFTRWMVSLWCLIRQISWSLDLWSLVLRFFDLFLGQSCSWFLESEMQNSHWFLYVFVLLVGRLFFNFEMQASWWSFIWHILPFTWLVGKIHGTNFVQIDCSSSIKHTNAHIPLGARTHREQTVAFNLDTKMSDAHCALSMASTHKSIADPH